MYVSVACSCTAQVQEVEKPEDVGYRTYQHEIYDKCQENDTFKDAWESIHQDKAPMTVVPWAAFEAHVS